MWNKCNISTTFLPTKTGCHIFLHIKSICWCFPSLEVETTSNHNQPLRVFYNPWSVDDTKAVQWRQSGYLGWSTRGNLFCCLLLPQTECAMMGQGRASSCTNGNREKQRGKHNTSVFWIVLKFYKSNQGTSPRYRGQFPTWAMACSPYKSHDMLTRRMLFSLQFACLVCGFWVCFGFVHMLSCVLTLFHSRFSLSTLSCGWICSRSCALPSPCD